MLPIPLHDSGDPAHITRLSSDRSPGRIGITCHIITLISVRSLSVGEGENPAGRRSECSRGHSSRSPFGAARRTIEHLELIYLHSGNQEADFNGHIVMNAAF